MRSVDTPSTKLRKQYDVNSPKVRNKKITFNNNAGAGQPTAVPDFMTQVERPDTNNKQNEHTRHMQEADERQEGCCTCCSSLFCGFFGTKHPKNAPTRELKNADRQGTNGDMGVSLDPLSRPQEDDQITATDDSGNEYDQDPPARNHRGGHQADVSSEEEDPNPAMQGLLGPKLKRHKGKKCLVLDLDETLVHSSFKPVSDADFIVPVEIDGVVYKVYVLKRPYVDQFLIECAKYYEVVVFTASLSKYANPLLDILDTQNVIAHRLFRESCVLHGQAYVKDLSKLGRPMRDIIIVDNSPLSYAFQPTSAIPILSWFDDRNDRQLPELLPVLKTTLRDIDDVRHLLDANNKSYEWLCAQAQRGVDQI